MKERIAQALSAIAAGGLLYFSRHKPLTLTAYLLAIAALLVAPFTNQFAAVLMASSVILHLILVLPDGEEDPCPGKSR